MSTMAATVNEVRQFPVTSIRDQVMARLDKIEAGAVILAVDGKLVDGGARAQVALMGRTSDGKWSFAGWFAHTAKPVKDIEAGFEVRRMFGGR